MTRRVDIDFDDRPPAETDSDDERIDGGRELIDADREEHDDVRRKDEVEG